MSRKLHAEQTTLDTGQTMVVIVQLPGEQAGGPQHALLPRQQLQHRAEEGGAELPSSFTVPGTATAGVAKIVTVLQAPPPPSRPAPDPPSYAAVTSYSRPDYSAPASSYLQDTKPEYESYSSVGQPTQYEPRYGSKVLRLTTLVFIHLLVAQQLYISVCAFFIFIYLFYVQKMYKQTHKNNSKIKIPGSLRAKRTPAAVETKTKTNSWI